MHTNEDRFANEHRNGQQMDTMRVRAHGWSPWFPKGQTMQKRTPIRTTYRRTLMPCVNLLVAVALALLTVLRPAPVAAQAPPTGYPLEKCQEGAFSTEEDFVM